MQGHISGITGGAPTFSQNAFAAPAMHGRPSTAPQPLAASSMGAAALRQSHAPMSSQQTYAPAWGSQPQDDWCGGGGGLPVVAPAPALPRSVSALRRSGISGGQLSDGFGRPGSAPDACELAAAAASGLTRGGASLGFQQNASSGGAQRSLLKDIEARPAPASGPASRALLQHPHALSAAARSAPADPSPSDGAGHGALVAPNSAAALASLEGRLDSMHERCAAVHDGVAALRKHLEQQASNLQTVSGACEEARDGVGRLAAAVAGVGERIEALFARQEGGSGVGADRRSVATACNAACQTSPGLLLGGAAPHARAPMPASGSQGRVTRRSSSPSAGPSTTGQAPSTATALPRASQGPLASSGSGKPGSQQVGTATKKRAGGRTARLLQQAASMPGQQLLRFTSGPAGAPPAPPEPARPAASHQQLAGLDARQQPGSAEPRTQARIATPEPFGAAAAAALVGLQTGPQPAATPPPTSATARSGSPRAFGGGGGDAGGSGRGSSSGDEDEDEGDEERIAHQLAARVASHRSKRLRRALSDYC